MIILKSHGFKFSRPEANIVFDASYLINPWRQKELRNSSKEKMLEFMESQKEFAKIVDMVVNSIITYQELWPDSKIVCAVCCSEGTYRSPMVIDAVARRLDNMKISYER